MHLVFKFKNYFQAVGVLLPVILVATCLRDSLTWQIARCQISQIFQLNHLSPVYDWGDLHVNFIQVMGDGARLCVAGFVGPTRRQAGIWSFYLSLPGNHLGKVRQETFKDIRLLPRCQASFTGELAAYSSFVTSHWNQRSKGNTTHN